MRIIDKIFADWELRYEFSWQGKDYMREILTRHLQTKRKFLYKFSNGTFTCDHEVDIWEFASLMYAFNYDLAHKMNAVISWNNRAKYIRWPLIEDSYADIRSWVSDNDPEIVFQKKHGMVAIVVTDLTKERW